MTHAEYVHRVVNLLAPDGDTLLNMDHAEAVRRVAAGDPALIDQIDGHFAILAQSGRMVHMARSIGRPMRYFLAKRAEGPCLVVAERIDELRDWLSAEGLGDQFHPSYTRMVPAHHLVRLELIGCPDPNPRYDRYFAPTRNSQPTDLDRIGEAYIGRLAEECSRWLDRIGPREPIGVMFSGGIDSGAVLIVLNHLLLQRGEAPTRLKAFTLRVDGESADADQAAKFLRQVGLEMLWEVLDCESPQLDWREAVRVIEDYKPLDVQAATMMLAACRVIRERYPDWKCLVDGDGGDENLKDYPIEDNPELTIRSVLNNLMLYQEGWGVHAIKHSLVHSGGQSRGQVRSFAPAKLLGFHGFSPFTLPRVIEIAEGIPFVELTDWDHQKLYSLKGEIVSRGVRHVTGVEMPVFEKRRFQRGAIAKDRFTRLFPKQEQAYRDAYTQVWA
ncbi:MAG: asparagine synthetase B family protein [Planctomycetaceae bacterium]|nr:MAG: asparagine synthetase B family protein [Planctomycetaceae bacterium]